MFTFVGSYYKRSSRLDFLPGNPAVGEKKIFELNPGRVDAIRHATGWVQVYHGTFNLSVRPWIHPLLSRIVPWWHEPPEMINVPEGYQAHIIRGGYNYYLARVEGMLVLIKRGADKPLSHHVGLIASVSLEEQLAASEGQRFHVDVFE